MPGSPHSPGGEANLAPATSGLPSFVRMDPPEHDDLRRLLTRDSVIKQMESLRPGVQDLVDGLIEDLPAGPQSADLVQAVAMNSSRAPRSVCGSLTTPATAQD